MDITQKQELGPLQKKWIAWLRANPDRQAKQQLQTDDNFCCLGVACVVCGVALADHLGRHEEPLKSQAYMPESVQEKMKFYTVSGSLRKNLRIAQDDTIYNLAGMNDRAGWSFAQIADYVEEDPSRVFSAAA
jgi:hypothetical protein